MPGEHEERITFVECDSDAIKALRRTTWPKRKKPETHPQRWTGTPLADDAKHATHEETARSLSRSRPSKLQSKGVRN